MTTTNERAVFATFAELFAYPHRDPRGAARRCLALIDSASGAKAGLKRFATWAAGARPGEVEEVYSQTFDLAPTCAPYVGHYICPEPARRNLFLSALAAVHAMEGFEAAEELDDHVAEVLRFLAVARDGEVRQELLREGLVPALEGIRSSLPRANPYRALVDAAHAFAAARVRRQRSRREEARP